MGFVGTVVLFVYGREGARELRYVRMWRWWDMCGSFDGGLVGIVGIVGECDCVREWDRV